MASRVSTDVMYHTSMKHCIDATSCSTVDLIAPALQYQSFKETNLSNKHLSLIE